MRKVLLRTKECDEFREKYRSGILTDNLLRQYIQDLMSNLRIGERFPFDTALALLAVGLEKFKTELAKEYLSELAELELAELPLSIEVSKVCLAEQRS